MKSLLSRGSKHRLSQRGILTLNNFQFSKFIRRAEKTCDGNLRNRLNYKLHPLSLVKVQFSPLSFDRFNLVL